MPKLTFLGHACFLLEEEGESTLIFDPFLSANPQAALKAEQVKADYILVSHAHHDHLGDAYTVAKNNGATIISTAEIAGAAQGEGCQAHALHIGGNTASLRLGKADRPSTLRIPAGMPADSWCTMPANLYFAGDTGLFGT